MSKGHAVAVPVKLFAFICCILGVCLNKKIEVSCLFCLMGFLYLALQRNYRFLGSYGIFYLVLSLLLYLIRCHGVHMILFSEFYVLMFWNLSPVFLMAWDLIMTPPGELAAFLSRIHMPTSVILGMLVIFRFFPTMKAELGRVLQSMKNRGLTSAKHVICHPAVSCEYVLVPMLLRILQIADQLSVSAVARGAECPGNRGSYHEKKMNAKDWIWFAIWAVCTICLLAYGGGSFD